MQETEVPDVLLIEVSDHMRQIQNCVGLASMGFSRDVTEKALREAARLIGELLDEDFETVNFSPMERTNELVDAAVQFVGQHSTRWLFDKK